VAALRRRYRQALMPVLAAFRPPPPRHPQLSPHYSPIGRAIRAAPRRPWLVSPAQPSVADRSVGSTRCYISSERHPTSRALRGVHYLFPIRDILAHVHPSGIAEPSKADEYITERVKQALALVGIKVLDHIIVAGGETMSFAERGMI
jgi:hypothetical protein